MSNNPFMMLNATQPGGNAPLGVLVSRNASAGTNGGDAAFANTLVQSLLTQSGAGLQASGQGNLLAANVLAKLFSGQSANDSAQLADALALLLGSPDGTAGEDGVSGFGQSSVLDALLVRLLAASDASGAEGTRTSSGQLLEEWLNGLQGEDTIPDHHQNALDNMIALLDLAQAVIQQWQPVEAKPVAETESPGTPAQQVQDGSMQSRNYAELLRTLRQLNDLRQQQPNQPEIVQLVDSFEQLLAPMMQRETDKGGQATPQAASAIPGPSVAEPQAPVAVPAAATLHASRWKTANAAAGQEEGRHMAAVQTLARGADLKGRLEALAAKASVMPHMMAIQPAEQSVQQEASGAETDMQASGAAQAPVQPDSIVRHANAASPVQPQEHVVHADRFAEEMAKALKSMKVHTANGLSEVRITLMPEHLGHIDVKVTMHNGQVVAQFMADTAHGKEMLEGQLAQLRAMLQTQGLQVDRLEVSQYNPPQSGSFQESKQQRQSGQSGRQNDDQADRELAPVDFLTELENVSGAKAATAGASFNETV
ncbi:flagellar hook-length control protein FliK [Paenibacillus hodogayensis]|uniref:Flagellar hook-length control protein FliK n=1 Tax=Paenibacillus hodogayensis TaxID=279208 RepID=A0ABV5W2F1_9BACL